jgi:protein-tyrosine phosphatase
MQLINSILTPIKGKVLVHCYQGISRSATFVLAYMIKFKKMRLEDAMRMLFDKRLIWPNNGFLEKLIRYEEQYL